MKEDPIAKRFGAREKQHKLDELAKKTRSSDDVKAEEKLLKETKKVDPIQGDGVPGRNEPCPCGSGKKYKKCCGAEKK